MRQRTSKSQESGTPGNSGGNMSAQINNSTNNSQNAASSSNETHRNTNQLSDNHNNINSNNDSNCAPVKENSLHRMMNLLNAEPYRQCSWDDDEDLSLSGYDHVSSKNSVSDSDAEQNNLNQNHSFDNFIATNRANDMQQNNDSIRNDETERLSVGDEPVERLELPPPRAVFGGNVGRFLPPIEQNNFASNSNMSVDSNFPSETDRAELGRATGPRPGPESERDEDEMDDALEAELDEAVGVVQGLLDMDPIPQPNPEPANGPVDNVDDPDAPGQAPLLGGIPPGALQDAFGEAFGMGFLGLSPTTNEEMINQLVTERKLTSQRLIDAFKKLDRKQYAPADEQDLAYEDMPIRSGHFIYLPPRWTGYLSSVVDHMLGPNGLNHGLEIHNDLVQFATTKAKNNGWDNIVFRQGNFKNLDINHAEHQRYDRVYIGAAAPGNNKSYFNLLNIVRMPPRTKAKLGRAALLMKNARAKENMFDDFRNHESIVDIDITEVEFTDKKSGERFTCEVEYLHSKDLSGELKTSLLDLTRVNIKEKYDLAAKQSASWAWDDEKKMSEICHKNARHFVLFAKLEESNQKIESEPERGVVGFAHIRFEVEAGKELVYLYEFQVDKKFERCGVGKHMLKLIESAGIVTKCKELALTCFKHNDAIDFYKKHGYGVDVDSPTEKNCPYQILSKPLRGIMVGPFEAEVSGQQHLRKIQRLSEKEFRVTSIKVVQFAKLQAPAADNTEKIVFRPPIWSPATHKFQPKNIRNGIKNLLGCIENAESTACIIPKEIWIQNIIPWVGRKFFDKKAVKLPEGVSHTITTLKEDGVEVASECEPIPLITVVDDNVNNKKKTDIKNDSKKHDKNDSGTTRPRKLKKGPKPQKNPFKREVSDVSMESVQNAVFPANNIETPSSGSKQPAPKQKLDMNLSDNHEVDNHNNNNNDNNNPATGSGQQVFNRRVRNESSMGSCSVSSSKVSRVSSNTNNDVNPGSPPSRPRMNLATPSGETSNNPIVIEDQTDDILEPNDRIRDGWSSDGDNNSNDNSQRPGFEHIGPNPDFFKTTYECDLCPVQEMKIEDVNLSDQPLGFRETNVGRTLQALLAVIRHRTRQEDRDAMAAADREREQNRNNMDNQNIDMNLNNMNQNPNAQNVVPGILNQALRNIAGPPPPPAPPALDTDLPDPRPRLRLNNAHFRRREEEIFDDDVLQNVHTPVRQQFQELHEEAARLRAEADDLRQQALLLTPAGLDNGTRRVWGHPADRLPENAWGPSADQVLPGQAVGSDAQSSDRRPSSTSVQSLHSSFQSASSVGVADSTRPAVFPTPSLLAWEDIRMPRRTEPIVDDQPMDVGASSSHEIPRGFRLPVRRTSTPKSSLGDIFHDAVGSSENNSNVSLTPNEDSSASAQVTTTTNILFSNEVQLHDITAENNNVTGEAGESDHNTVQEVMPDADLLRLIQPRSTNPNPIPAAMLQELQSLAFMDFSDFSDSGSEGDNLSEFADAQENNNIFSAENIAAERNDVNNSGGGGSDGLGGEGVVPSETSSEDSSFSASSLTTSYNEKLKALAFRPQQHVAALLIYDEMCSKDVPINKVTYSALMSCLKGYRDVPGQWKTALKLLEKAELNNEADVVVYSSCMSVCQHNHEICFDILERMKKRNVPMNVFSYTSCMSALEKQGLWERAIELLEIMANENIMPNYKTYSSAISCCGKGLQWQRSLDLLDQMRNQKLTPNLVVFNAAMSACEKGGNPEKVFELFEGLKKFRLKPDLFSYIALMSSCSRLANYKKAMLFLDEMEKNNIKPTKEIWTSVITACGKAYECDLAISCLTRMKSGGFVPNPHVFASIISDLGRVGRYQEAIQFFNKMDKRDRTELHYNSVLLAIRSNDFEEEIKIDVVFDLIRDMRDINLRMSLLLAKTCLLTTVTTKNYYHCGTAMYSELAV
eukprot:gene34-506_t